MAEAIKSVRKIAKKLIQTFQQIAFVTAKSLARSSKYGNQYMEEYQKLARKMNKEQVNGRSLQNKKFKQQRDLLKKQYAQLKAKYEKKRRVEKQRKNQDSDDLGSSPQSKQRYRGKQNKVHYENPRIQDLTKSKRQIIIDKRNEKIQQRNNLASLSKHQSRKAIQKQKQIDFNRDFDFNKPYNAKRNTDNTIFQQQEQSKVNQKVSKVKKLVKWSDRKPLSIGSEDPQKYKILVVDEQASDFQDDDAILKVPQIKPRQPLTPYFLFLRVNKHAISKSFPNVNSQRGYAKVWQDLPQQQKKPFFDQFDRSYKIYKNKLNQYYSIHPQMQNQGQGKITQQPKQKHPQIVATSKKAKKSSSKKQSKSKSNKKQSKKNDSDYSI